MGPKGAVALWLLCLLGLAGHAQGLACARGRPRGNSAGGKGWVDSLSLGGLIAMCSGLSQSQRTGSDAHV